MSRAHVNKREYYYTNVVDSNRSHVENKSFDKIGENYTDLARMNDKNRCKKQRAPGALYAYILHFGLFAVVLRISFFVFDSEFSKDFGFGVNTIF